MTTTVHIHFVCRGNVFRSRVAEAYARSLALPGWQISSSGIEASTYAPDFISPWSTTIGRQHRLTHFFSTTTQQTTSELLQAADIIVFMDRHVFLEAQAAYTFNADKALVWSVKDADEWPQRMSIGQRRTYTFANVKRLVDKLVYDATRCNWIDIVDDSNKPLGFKLPVTIANEKGLWHRGCHVLITTPELRTFVQKRAKRIIFSPNLIDVTLGGHVDAGETPPQAAVREMREEMGLTVNAADLKLLEVCKWHSYHPRYKRYSNAFIYSYHMPIAESNPQVHIQKKEVAAVALLSPSQLHRLLRMHRLLHFGRLNYPHVFYLRTAQLAGIVRGR